jgi:hypothetical protein
MNYRTHKINVKLVLNIVTLFQRLVTNVNKSKD